MNEAILSRLQRRIEHGEFGVGEVHCRSVGSAFFSGGSIELPPEEPSGKVWLMAGRLSLDEGSGGICLGGWTHREGVHRIDPHVLPDVAAWGLLERDDPTYVFLQGLRDHTVYLTRVLSDHPTLLGSQPYFSELRARSLRTLALLGLEHSPLAWCRRLVADRADVAPPEEERGWCEGHRALLRRLEDLEIGVVSFTSFLAFAAEHERTFIQRAIRVQPLSMQADPELTGIFDADLPLDAIVQTEGILAGERPEIELRLAHREIVMFLLAGDDDLVYPATWLKDLYVHGENLQTRVPLRCASGREDRMVGSVELPQGRYLIGRDADAPPLRLWIYLLARKPH